MIRVYIDESGCLDNKHRFFVIACLVPHSESSNKHIKNIIKKSFVKFCLNTDQSEIKASNLKFSQKQNILSNISKFADHSIYYIAVDNQKINPTLFKEKNVCYNFLTGILLKEVFKTCSDSIDIIIDNHTTKVSPPLIL